MWSQFKSYTVDMFALAIAFMSPITGVVVAMLCFVFFDMVTGILKARKIAANKAEEAGKTKEKVKEDKREVVQSRKMSHSVAKFIFYFAGILLAHLINHFMELEMPLVKMVLGFIMLIELKSIDENMKVVLGYSIFGKLLDVIKRTDVPPTDENK